MDKKLEITYLKGVNSIVIKKDVDDRFFTSSPTGLVISVPSLAMLLKFLINNNFLSYRVLEGILEEYHSTRF